MKRCPKCERISIDKDPQTHIERCLWYSCLWENRNKEELDSKKYRINYKKFRESIKAKRSVASL